jgi:hypothetical protein
VVAVVAVLICEPLELLLVLVAMGAVALGKLARQMQHLEPKTQAAEAAVLLIILRPLIFGNQALAALAL